MPIFPTEGAETPGPPADDEALAPDPFSLAAMERAFTDWLSDYKSVQSDAWRDLNPHEAATLVQAHWDDLLGFYESHLRQLQANLKRGKGITPL